MITQLLLQDIGPVAGLTADFGERLNLVTGDNGLGKTFLPDACWYALTRTWADALHGSAENWLSSESFDLASGYPVAAELAIKQADAFMLAHPDPDTAPTAVMARIHQDLMAALGGDDEYWPFWLPYFQADCGHAGQGTPTGGVPKP
jgi:hypothetical protein